MLCCPLININKYTRYLEQEFLNTSNAISKCCNENEEALWFFSTRELSNKAFYFSRCKRRKPVYVRYSLFDSIQRTLRRVSEPKSAANNNFHIFQCFGESITYSGGLTFLMTLSL